MAHDNAAIVRAWFDGVWNDRRADLIDALLTPESVCFGENGPIRGIDEFKERQHAPFLAAFSRLHIQIDDLIEQGDQVVVRWTAVGTHDGDGLGFPATHKPAQFSGITWVRIRDGKLIEGWQSSNIPLVFRDLGQPTGDDAHEDRSAARS